MEELTFEQAFRQLEETVHSLEAGELPLGEALARQMRQRMLVRRMEVEGMQARLVSLDPRAVLLRGYAIVQQEATGQVVASVRQVSAGDRLRILVVDGDFETSVLG